MALAQAEYTIGLWPFAHRLGFEGGMHAIVFFDAGHRVVQIPTRTVGRSTASTWRPTAASGSSTSEDNVRIYVAQEPPGAELRLRLRAAIAAAVLMR